MEKGKHIVWFDVVRLAAFLFLLICHAADPFNAAATRGNAGTVGELAVAWGQIWGSFVRPCVPLFVMLTGALLLPVKQPMEAFYKRRISRVLWPFLIWSVLYNLFPWFTGLVGADSSVVYKFFPYAESNSQQIDNCLREVARIPYTFNAIACHMWYIYMLIGLYLFLPVFSAWVEKATKRQKQFFLLLWLLSTLLPYMQQYLGNYLFGTCSWNAFGTFYYFSGFCGYLLLGHYVRQYVHLNLPVVLPVCLFLFIAGYAVTYFGFIHMVYLPNRTPEEVELFWTYNSLNVVAQSFAVFLLIKHINISGKGTFAKMLANLTTCGFGIYMVHYFFVGPCYMMVSLLNLPVPLQIPCSAVLILALAWTLVFLLKKAFGPISRIVLG